ncbi:E3 ubiquitin-protein ligase MIEL1 [Cardamine amara subsp. amara]|uniref:E3 ubiquitin-protein ligase MIEL1 n=1 Tax=Cardamine amara subsp. amara TaxID=228776 RepID=A0ABD1C4M2_CARAN
METDSSIPRDKDFGKLEFGCEHYRGDVKSELLAITSQRILYLILNNDMIWLFVQYVKQSKRLLKSVPIVVFEWGNTSAIFANSLMTIPQKKNFIVMTGIFGGRDNFFHCQNCGACYVTELRDKHSCVENSTKNSCPLCYEYLFDSVKAAHVMSCGHTMHGDCFQQMTKEEEYYRCPICSKSLVDMSDEWQLLDREISATAMLVEYNFEVTVLCNDCNKRSTAMFHILGPKCAHCSSYNTRRISTPQDPVSETV